MPSLPPSKRRPWQPAPVKREYKPHAVRTPLYDTPRWRRVRLAHLMQHPLCVLCQEEGRITSATVVDHITPYNDGGDFWDSANHQGLCNPHHAAKSAREGHQKRKSSNQPEQ